MQTDQLVIRRGTDVIGPDGPLGKVAHVVVDEPTREIRDFVLQRPDGHEWLLPADTVASTTDTTIILRAPWSELSATARPYAADEFEALSKSATIRAAVPAFTTSASATTLVSANPRADGTLELREEELQLRKETQERGAVELRKEVISERQAFDIPVWHEELILERDVIDPPQVCEDRVGEDRSIRVILREEVALVDKQPVVTEFVRAGRRTVPETQRIETDVRREVADVQTKATFGFANLTISGEINDHHEFRTFHGRRRFQRPVHGRASRRGFAQGWIQQRADRLRDT